MLIAGDDNALSAVQPSLRPADAFPAEKAVTVKAAAAYANLRIFISAITEFSPVHTT